MGIEKGTYRDLIMFFGTTLSRSVTNYSKLATAIFNGLDMFNKYDKDGDNDLKEAKERGKQVIRLIMPQVKEEEIEPIKKILCEIFVNANKRFMSGRVIQYELSGESRCFYSTYDTRYEIDSKKCGAYLHQLMCAVLDDEIFTPNLEDLDQDMISLVIAQPHSAFSICTIKKQMDRHPSITEEAKKDIMFAQTLFESRLMLDYLCDQLDFLFTKCDFNENTMEKVMLMSNYWSFHSCWCNQYELYDSASENVAFNPDKDAYEQLRRSYEQEQPTYSELKTVLNRILIQGSKLDVEHFKKLNSNSFFQELKEVGNQNQVVKQLIFKKIQKNDQK